MPRTLEQISADLDVIKETTAETRSILREINGSVRRHDTDIALLKLQDRELDRKLTEHNAAAGTSFRDHEKRIRVAEASLWKLIALVAATSGTTVTLAKLFF